MSIFVNQTTVKWASRVAWPILRAGGEKTTWRDRWAPGAPTAPVDLWIHTASLGEIAPLTNLIAGLPGPVGVTVTSGRSLAAVATRLDGIATVRPLPIPRGPGFAALVDAWQPKRLVLLEAEAWPALVDLVPDRIGALAVLGGRMKFPIDRAWRKFFNRPNAVQALRGVWVGDHETRQNYLDCGCPASALHTGYRPKLVHVEPAHADDGFRLWRDGKGLRLVAGSIHPDEVNVLLAAWRAIAAKDAEARMLIVPRHPERGADIAAKFKQAQVQAELWPALGQVTVVSSYGVLAGLYELADVAIVGGSWNGKGGHNPVEAAVHGITVVMGPSIDNQQDLFDIGGGQIVIAADAAELVAAIFAALHKPRLADSPFRRYTESVRAMALAALS